MKKQCHLIRALAKGGLDQLHLIIEWIEGMTPDKTWSCLFTNPIFDNLVEQTQFYAIRDKENHNFYQIISKAYQFIGIFLLYGYCKVAKEKDYWSSQTGLHVPFIANAMTRNKYFADKAVFTCCRQQKSC